MHVLDCGEMELPEFDLKLGELDEEVLSLAVAATGALVLLLTIWKFLRPDQEAAVKFTVSPPEVGDNFVDDKEVDEVR